MGVLGLTPFLHKHLPAVIKILPDRLRSLAGSTIVIDATLVTQRLHFAPLPHKYRHVLGWYKLVMELNKNDVKAICVFDGLERSEAKALEVQRRRYLRRVLLARGNFELERLTRLQRLTSILRGYQALPLDQRVVASTSVRALLDGLPLQEQPDTKPLPGSKKSPYIDVFHEEDIRVPSDTSFDVELEQSDVLTEKELCSLLRESLASDAEPEPSDIERYWTKHDATLDKATVDFGIGPSEELEYAQSDELLEKLSTLFEEYRASRQIAQEDSTKSLDTQDESNRRSDLSLPIDFTESRTQQALSVEEGSLWNNIATLLEEDPEDSASLKVHHLLDRSQVVSRSYERRSKPPTVETYEESRTILQALGIPCITCSGPYEAEGLASSIVLSKHADYVASEDTDVLAYEAPLLRNLTNRSGPLMLISGAEVRQTLGLDRASYIDFLLLLGTDFSRRIRNVGPARALKFIREYGSIENIIEHERQFVPEGLKTDAAYLAQVNLARQVFQKLPPIPDPALFEQREPDMTLISRLITRFSLARAVLEDEIQWDSSAALAGNYFHDAPGSLTSINDPLSIAFSSHT